MRGQPVDNRIGRDGFLIHLQEDDFFAVRRPEVVTAHTQLFGVHPIHFAVQDVLVRVLGQGLAILRSHRLDEEVVLAHVGDVSSIGRELGILSRVGR